MAEEIFDTNDAEGRRDYAVNKIHALIDDLIKFERKYKEQRLDSNGQCRDCFDEMKKWLYDDIKDINDAADYLRW